METTVGVRIHRSRGRRGRDDGAAAGVTLGLAMSAGGLFAPACGLVAEHHGPEGVFTLVCAVPLAAVVLGLLLKKP